MNEVNDEISLRELYLIVKRGLPLILIITVLTAAAAFAITNMRPERFQAETTVLINPTPVRVEGTGSFLLEQRNDISWEMYQAIAYSPAVLEDAAARLGNPDVTVGTLRSNSDLTRLMGPQQPTQVAPLTISHSVTHVDPRVAAAASEAWASAAADTAGASMVASLETLRGATNEQLRALSARLGELEDRWEDFQSRDESLLIEAQLLALGERIPEVEAIAQDAERMLAAAQASQQLLASVEVTATSTDLGDARAATALLGGRAESPSNAVAELNALLLSQEGLEADIVTLIRQVELQRLSVDVAGLTAQLETAHEQLSALRAQGQELRGRQAGLVVERDRLQQQLDVARQAQAELAQFEPVLEYIYQLAPTNSRVLNSAAIPTGALGASPAIVAAIAGAIAFLLALLFVFLRAAIAEPPSSARRERARTSAVE